MASSGLSPAAHLWQPIPHQLGPSHPVATILPAASHNPNTSTVIANAWNVFSRHKASVEPRLPQTSTLASVTANTRAIWSNETPPNRADSMNSGNAPTSITSMLSRLATSLPSTSSLLESRVNSNSTRVRRSFSWATALAANMAEKNTASANCKGARIWNRIAPKRARSPTSRTRCAPANLSQAVVISTSSAAT